MLKFLAIFLTLGLLSACTHSNEASAPITGQGTPKATIEKMYQTGAVQPNYERFSQCFHDVPKPTLKLHFEALETGAEFQQRLIQHYGKDAVSKFNDIEVVNGYWLSDLDQEAQVAEADIKYASEDQAAYRGINLKRVKGAWRIVEPFYQREDLIKDFIEQDKRGLKIMENDEDKKISLRELKQRMVEGASTK